jgi:hypothetical protein
MPKSRQQRRAHARRPLGRRRRSALIFTIILSLLVVGGSALGFVFIKHPPPITRGAIVGEHWHASYKIYICGKRMANYPTVEGEIHSHGDGFLHIHPSDATYAGDNANLGKFLLLYETTFTVDAKGHRVMTFPTGTSVKDGEKCSNKKRYNWVFTNKGKTVKGDPSVFLPHDGDVLVMSFGPKGSGTLPNPYSIKHPEAGVGSPLPPGTTPGPDTAQIPPGLLTQTPAPSGAAPQSPPAGTP